MKGLTVGQVMSTNVVSVRAGTGFKDVAAVLAEHGISGVPVVDDDHRVIGVVTEADLIAKETTKTLVEEPHHVLVSRRRRREHVKAAGCLARDIMSSPAITIDSGATIAAAARRLAEHGYRRLPVVDAQGVLVGVVSRADLVRVFLRPDEEIRQEVLREVIKRSLWQDPALFQVLVRDGVVTLRGELETAGMIPIAVRLTETLDGVVKVISELTYGWDDRVQETWRHGG